VSFDGTVPVQKLLSAIYRVDQRFAAGHVIDVLRGVQTERIKPVAPRFAVRVRHRRRPQRAGMARHRAPGDRAGAW
jgi:superfamily II DNA helicase RecQ